MNAKSTFSALMLVALSAGAAAASPDDDAWKAYQFLVGEWTGEVRVVSQAKGPDGSHLRGTSKRRSSCGGIEPSIPLRKAGRPSLMKTSW